MTEKFEHLSEPFFSDIKSGLKKYEGRLNKNMRWMVNDIVIWFNDNGEKFTTRISRTIIFPSFKDAIESVGLENILPSEHKINSSVDQAIKNTYRRWYSEEKELELGVILLEFEK
jgi:ASC-1-like (ASCH) protein